MRPPKLPADIRDLVARLSRGERVARHAALPIPSRRVAWRVALGMLAGSGVLLQWLALHLNLFGGYKGYADDEDFLLSTPLAVIGALISVHLLLAAIAIARSRTKPALIATPALMIVTGHDDQPMRVDAITDERRYAIDGSRVRTSVDGRSLVAHAEEPAEARRFVDAAEALAREARALPSDAAAHDWRPRVATGGRSLAPLGRFALAFAVAVFVVAPISFGAWVAGLARESDARWAECESGGYCRYDGLAGFAANDFPELVLEALDVPARAQQSRDQNEERAWRHVASSTSPSPLRDYLAREDARHRDEARTRIAELYRQRTATYAAEAATSGADPALVAGMQRVLLALGGAESSSVGIALTPDPGLETGTIESVFAALTTSRVAPLGPAFTAERNRAREHEVIEAVRLAAQRQLYEYVQLGTAATPAAPRIAIAYRVEPSGAIYVDRAERELPESERTIYPGLRIVFECAIVAGPTDEHPARIVAEPAPDLTVTGAAGARPDAAQVYDRMIETAFDHLRDQLVRAFGGTPPAPRWLSWLPEVPGAELDDPGGGDQYTARIDVGSVEWIAGDYRARLEAAGFTVTPFLGAALEAHDWVARRDAQAAHVRVQSGPYARGAFIVASDVSGLAL